MGINAVALRTFLPHRYDEVVNTKLFVVLTDSMEPTIPPMSLIFVDRDVDHFAKGDIISFKVDINDKGNKDIVTHRLESIDDGLIKTRSDKSGQIDPWKIKEHNVIGKVKLSIPHLGGFVLGIQKVAIPVLLISQLLIIVILLQTILRWKEI